MDKPSSTRLPFVADETGPMSEAMIMNSPKEQTFPSCHDTCGTFSDGTDDPVRVCHDCQAGCTSRRTEKSTEEEISAGPYLIFAAIIMIAISAAIKWLF